MLHPIEMAGTFAGGKNAIIRAGSRPGCHSYCRLGISQNEITDVFVNFGQAYVLLIKSVRTTLPLAFIFSLLFFFANKCKKPEMSSYIDRYMDIYGYIHVFIHIRLLVQNRLIF